MEEGQHGTSSSSTDEPLSDPIRLSFRGNVVEIDLDAVLYSNKAVVATYLGDDGIVHLQRAPEGDDNQSPAIVTASYKQIPAINPSSNHSITPDPTKESADASLVAKSKEPATMKEESAVKRSVSLRQLYRYSTWKERIILFFGALAALGNGVVWPIWGVLFSSALGDFNDKSTLASSIRSESLSFLWLGIGTGVAQFIQIFVFTRQSEVQLAKLKRAYLRAVFRQEISWLDLQSSAAIGDRFASHFPKIKSVYDERMSTLLYAIGRFIPGLIIAFVANWKLSLVVISLMPTVVLGFAFTGMIQAKKKGKQNEGYSIAAAVAAEDIGLIRTIYSFCTQGYELNRFEQAVEGAYKSDKRFYVFSSLSTALPYLFMFSVHALAFGYGSKLVRDGTIEGSKVIRVLMSVILASTGFGQGVPVYNEISHAQQIAADVYDVIDRQSALDPFSTSGIIPEENRGELDLANLHFAYPARPNDTILHGLSLKIKQGQTVALVGPSGGGKSTVLSMILRLYDPISGDVKLDGTNLKDINLRWLRNQIAVVEQSTTLFPGTILENIALGKQDATLEEVVNAAKLAHAHDFIMSFPHGYDTSVGDAGNQLSGGQSAYQCCTGPCASTQDSPA